ncbi:MAG TPA: CbiX/SirB N-terminal domain-containing protein [Bryobacteraceae bacterium]|nr:CbiX/SirB N-terminal domain-containing protein [Bryobacteraceae bacterium]
MTGVIVFAHGSTVESANDAVRTVTSEFARRGGYALTGTAFLDCAPPTLADEVARLVAAGASRIIVVPYFLTLGIHLQRDLPNIIEKIREREHVPVDVAEPLDGHPALVDIVLDRAREYTHGGGSSAGTAG